VLCDTLGPVFILETTSSYLNSYSVCAYVQIYMAQWHDTTTPTAKSQSFKPEKRNAG